MQHDAFIGYVQERARLGSRGEAERATRATLETIAERIPAGLAENLAAQLPHEVGEHMRRVTHAVDEPEEGERFGRIEFLDRVAERAGGGTEAGDAASWARAVFAVVDEATSGSSTHKVFDSLPDDVRALLGTGANSS